ncbi:flagellar FliJ family protein [Arenibaculum pallidiluteum]|uniref:flagellar FliJ family protein n=1 Tax=Arenibaculum pallidiluteum TaxID=2812559 RepID=UPI001A96E2F3|nr:flagellar FliJ family protein [Arenibaculum pallidiluteum]
MSELKTLIRLHKWKLDEKQRALAELEALAERLSGEKQRLEDEVLAEQAAARESAEVGYGYAAYAKVAIERRRRLEESIEQVARQIEAARDEMADAFQELKRYELAQEGRDRRERERLRRREGAMLDEVAVTGFARRRRETAGP